MKTGFNTEYLEEIEFLEVLELEVRKYSGDYIKKLFRDINVNLLRRMNNHFKQDDNGSQRNWVSMEEQ